ncbi:MAG: thiamine-phosphate kinase [Candidatus Micrarchaeia archaeon]
MPAIKSELDFLKAISNRPRLADSLLGIGDDAAVVRGRQGVYAITTDMMVEGDHFSLDYFTPFDIGVKAMESNVSDIAAMGATPLFAFISIALKPGTSMDFVKDFYRGLYASAKKRGVDVLGGDTTHGPTMVVNITIIGYAKSAKGLVYRSGARAGDLIFVTGMLGASTAGLKLFLNKIPGHAYVKAKHRRPCCRLDISDKIAGIANSMEDVSDGLASEVRNICHESGKGAVIYAENVPIDGRTIKAARAAGNSALDYALFGGEDFELVYTVPKRLGKQAAKFGTLVGEITPQKGKIFLLLNGKKELLTHFGYDHFSKVPGK